MLHAKVCLTLLFMELPIRDIRDVTCRMMRSHNVTYRLPVCHPIQVKTAGLNSSQTGRYLIYESRSKISYRSPNTF